MTRFAKLVLFLAIACFTTGAEKPPQEAYPPDADEAVRAHFPSFEAKHPELLKLSTPQLLDWISKKGSAQNDWGCEALRILEARAAKRTEDDLWNAQGQLFGWLTAKKALARRENVARVLTELFKNPGFMSRPIPPSICPALKNIVAQDPGHDGTLSNVQGQAVRLVVALAERDPEFTNETLLLALRSPSSASRLLAGQGLIDLGLNEKKTAAIENAIATEAKLGFAFAMIQRFVNAAPASLDSTVARIRRPKIYKTLFQILRLGEHEGLNAQAAELLSYLAMIQDPTAEEKNAMKRALIYVRERSEIDRGYIRRSLVDGRSVPMAASIAENYESALILLGAAAGESPATKQEDWAFLRPHKPASESKDHEPSRSLPRE